MAVYREGYHILKQLQTAAKRVFEDAADYGAPIDKSGPLWNAIAQLYQMYGVKDSKKKEAADTFTFEFTLMDEWSPHKSEKEATERYRLTYTKLASWQKKPYLSPEFKGKHGFAYIVKI